MKPRPFDIFFVAVFVLLCAAALFLTRRVETKGGLFNPRHLASFASTPEDIDAVQKVLYDFYRFADDCGAKLYVNIVPTPWAVLREWGGRSDNRSEFGAKLFRYTAYSDLKTVYSFDVLFENRFRAIYDETTGYMTDFGVFLSYVELMKKINADFTQKDPSRRVMVIGDDYSDGLYGFFEKDFQTVRQYRFSSVWKNPDDLRKELSLAKTAAADFQPDLLVLNLYSGYFHGGK